LPANTEGAPRHDWLTLTGGAIGQRLPVAVGAAIACPDRPVIALEADGSALYTIQSLWTIAREQLNVTVVIFNDRGYGILDAELARLDGQSAGDRARALLNLGDPDLDFVELGTGFGIPSRRVDTAEQLTDILDQAIADPGPHLNRGCPPRFLQPPLDAGCSPTTFEPLATALSDSEAVKRRVAQPVSCG
jgi:acetolactate synthase I/II/III large subunit